MSVVTQKDLERIREKIEKILESDMEVNDYIGDIVPSIGDLPDKNKGLIITKCTILFVDIRSSTELSDKTQAKNMAKIYRAFARAMSECIYTSGGQVRQIAGDRVMGVFVDDSEESSATKALMASRAIISVIEYVLNPICKKYINNKTINCGVGIDTGRVLTTSIGMRYRGEDSRDLVWAGKIANVASKHTDLAEAKEIFVTKRYYNYLNSQYKKDEDGNNLWSKANRIKGNSVFFFFFIHSHFLDFLDRDKVTKKEDLTEERVNNKAFVYMLNEISKEANNLFTKLENVIKREQEVEKKEALLLDKGKELNVREAKIDKEEKEISRLKSTAIFELEKAKNEAVYGVKIDYLNKNIKLLSYTSCIEMLEEIQSIGEKLGKNKIQSRDDINFWSLINFFIKNSFYEIAYQLMLEQLKDNFKDVNYPFVTDVVEIITKLDRKNDYIKAIVVHVNKFNPSRKMLKEFWHVIELANGEENLTSSERALFFNGIF